MGDVACMEWKTLNRILDVALTTVGGKFLQVSGKLDFYDGTHAQDSAKTPTFDEEDDLAHHYKHIKKGDSRAKFAHDVPYSVKRFVFNTAPHKFWAEHFYDKEFNAVYSMVKYDGWFVVIYVADDNTIQWQTTSGFLHNDIERQIHKFLEFLKQRVIAKVLVPKNAIKLEVTVEDKQGVQHLWLVGKRFDTALYSYKIYITDFFEPYTPAMNDALVAVLSGERGRARLNKAKPLSATEWVRIFAAQQGNIVQRLQNLNTKLGAIPPNTNVKIGENEEVHGFTEGGPTLKGRDLITNLSKALQERPIEGFVLHCYTQDAGQTDAHDPVYSIFKFKQEYMGGLACFYTYGIDVNIQKIVPAITMYAGRQFVVRVLTVECLSGTSIPYQLGIGYYDENLYLWVVTDCVKVKYVGGKRMKDVDDASPFKGERYLDSYLSRMVVPNAEGIVEPRKHTGVTNQTQRLANLIAKVLDYAATDEGFMQKAREFKNLHMTSHFKTEASANILNVSDLGIIIGGSCNAVYRSESNHFHLQAVVLKCMGLSESGSSYKFTVDNIENARIFHQHARHCIPKSISTEWSKETWKQMTDISALNKSDVLSQAKEKCYIHERLSEVSKAVNIDKEIYVPPKDLSWLHCSAYKVDDSCGKYFTDRDGKRKLHQVHIKTMIEALNGQFIEKPRPNDQIDIIFIPSEGKAFNAGMFRNITEKLKTQFVLIRISWLVETYMSTIGQSKQAKKLLTNFVADYGPTGDPDKYLDDPLRFLWDRAKARKAAGPAARPASERSAGGSVAGPSRESEERARRAAAAAGAAAAGASGAAAAGASGAAQKPGDETDSARSVSPEGSRSDSPILTRPDPTPAASKHSASAAAKAAAEKQTPAKRPLDPTSGVEGSAPASPRRARHEDSSGKPADQTIVIEDSPPRNASTQRPPTARSHPSPSQPPPSTPKKSAQKMLDDLDEKDEQRERQAEERAKADAAERAENLRKQREAMEAAHAAKAENDRKKLEAAHAAKAENDRKKLEEMNAGSSAPPAAPSSDVSHGVLRGADGHEYVADSQSQGPEPTAQGTGGPPTGQDTGGPAAPARGGGRPETQHAQKQDAEPTAQGTGGAAAPARGGGRPESQNAQQWHVDHDGNQVPDDVYDTDSDSD